MIVTLPLLVRLEPISMRGRHLRLWRWVVDGMYDRFTFFDCKISKHRAFQHLKFLFYLHFLLELSLSLFGVDDKRRLIVVRHLVLLVQL
jgi:hypothetical protein